MDNTTVGYILMSIGGLWFAAIALHLVYRIYKRLKRDREEINGNLTEYSE